MGFVSKVRVLIESFVRKALYKRGYDEHGKHGQGYGEHESYPAVAPGEHSSPSGQHDDTCAENVQYQEYLKLPQRNSIV